MSKRVAIIKDGKVDNIILVPDHWPNVRNAWKPKKEESTEVIKPTNRKISIGDTHANKQSKG